MVNLSYNLLTLLSTLVLVVNVQANCVKVSETRMINLDGYRTRVVHTNACQETSRAKLMPRMSLGYAEKKPFVKMFEDSCCCVVTSHSQHTVVLEPVAVDPSTPARVMRYRRIEGCGCVRCSVADVIENAMDIEYNDNSETFQR